MTPMTPTTPPAIPSDILDAAREVMIGLYLNPERDAALVAAIARALLAAQERGKLMERERCAGIAGRFAWANMLDNEPTDASSACQCIANTIREGL